MHLFEPMECATPTVNYNANYELWMITCQCRFILGNKSATPVSDGDNVGGYARVKTESIWEIFVPFSQFFCKTKTALKNI